MTSLIIDGKKEENKRERWCMIWQKPDSTVSVSSLEMKVHCPVVCVVEGVIVVRWVLRSLCFRCCNCYCCSFLESSSLALVSLCIRRWNSFCSFSFAVAFFRLSHSACDQCVLHYYRSSSYMAARIYWCIWGKTFVAIILSSAETPY